MKHIRVFLSSSEEVDDDVARFLKIINNENHDKTRSPFQIEQH